MRFWRSIHGVSWSRVAKWSCQKSVIFSSSGRCVRIIRSSHHSASWPHSLIGSSGLPSTLGAGPTSCAPPPRFTSHLTVASCPAAAQRRASSGVAPKPARQSRRRTCFSDQGIRVMDRRGAGRPFAVRKLPVGGGGGGGVFLVGGGFAARGGRGGA